MNSTISSDIFNVLNTINWRTYRNLNFIHTICGTNQNIEMHHVKSIKKEKVSGFNQVIKQLN